MIEVDLDCYGSLARASCLADFLEVAAILGISFTRAQLADVIEDRWPRHRTKLVDPLDDPQHDDDDHSEQAFHCLNERSRILGDLYPFRVGAHRIELKPGFDIETSSYILLLGITVVHAFKLDCGFNVKEAFEEHVTDSFKQIGWASGNVGGLYRQFGGQFETMMAKLGEEVNIPLNPRGAVRRRFANDSGVDVLVHLDFGDGRLGRWTAIGQVTCGSSETWEGKLGEAKAPRWMKFMSEMVPPRVFLAIPHDIEERTLRSLSQDSNHSVLDRTRLVPKVRPQSDEIRALLGAIRIAGVQSVLV